MATSDQPKDMRPPLQVENMARILTDLNSSISAAMHTVLEAPGVAARYAETIQSRPGPAGAASGGQ